MSLTIHKFSVEIADVQEIPLSPGAKILSIQHQHNRLFLWALIDPHAKPVRRIIECFGTGMQVPDPDANIRLYLTTIQTDHGQFVWHFFDRGERS